MQSARDSASSAMLRRTGLRLPFFYGWVVVSVTMLAGSVGAWLHFAPMAVVLKPLTDDLGWSRSSLAGAITAGGISAALVAPLVGRLADRYGPRTMISLGAGIVGALALTISFIREPWQFYALYVPALALASTVLWGVVPQAAVTNWFERKRPRAMGLVVTASPLGATVAILVYQYVVSHAGWRTTFLIAGSLIWILAILPAALLLRRQPEDLGLLPDGQANLALGASAPKTAAPSGKRDWTLKEALGTRAFWLLIGGNALVATASAGVTFNLVAYLTDGHTEPAVAAGALAVLQIAVLAGTALWGFMGERFTAKALGVVSFLSSAVFTLLLVVEPSELVAYAYAIVSGLAMRAPVVLTPLLLAGFFGRKSFGAINGSGQAFWSAGLGLGPLIAATAFDHTRTYEGIFLLFVVAYILAAALTALLRAPAARG